MKKEKFDYVLLEDFYPFLKGDKLKVTHRTTLYVPDTVSFDHPSENTFVRIPKSLLERLD